METVNVKSLPDKITRRGVKYTFFSAIERPAMDAIGYGCKVLRVNVEKPKVGYSEESVNQIWYEGKISRATADSLKQDLYDSQKPNYFYYINGMRSYSEKQIRYNLT